MNFEILKCDYENAKKANKLLTKLIKDEKQYDENINEKCIVTSLYEKFYDDEDVCLLVALKEGSVIGYVYGFIENSGDAVINKICILDALYVEKEYRRCGVGKKLINELKIWGKEKDAKHMELKVLLQNEKAKNLYKSLDFKEKKVILSCDL